VFTACHELVRLHLAGPRDIDNINRVDKCFEHLLYRKEMHFTLTQFPRISYGFRKIKHKHLQYAYVLKLGCS
jgi:hypothetical protein